jgi:hypothetical protein
MKRTIAFALMTGLALCTGACACRGGHIGPYGGVHPGRCWIW